MKELAYFPAPLQGETIYSVCARFHRVVGGSAAVNARLLHMNGAHAAPAVPVGLRFLERATGGLLVASEETLRTRSILRAFLPLMPIEKRQELVQICNDASGAAVGRSRAGLNRYTSCAKLLKYCESCALIDLAEHSHTFWHTDHQLPGVWTCSIHREPLAFIRQIGKRRGWWLPRDEDLEVVRLVPDSHAALKLLAIGRCVTWISDHRQLDVGLLQRLVKSRLRAAGYCRSELKLSTSEAAHLPGAAQKYFSSLGAPDIQMINASDWTSRILGEKSHYDPLTWAMALAWVGDTQSQALARQYSDIQCRAAQPDLIRSHTRVRWAPAELYRACESGESKSGVARIADRTLAEVDRWLRSDPALKSCWLSAKWRRKRADAVDEMRRFIVRFPGSGRSTILKNCRVSYKWLQVNDPQALERTVPAPATWVRQLSLFT